MPHPRDVVLGLAPRTDSLWWKDCQHVNLEAFVHVLDCGFDALEQQAKTGEKMPVETYSDFMHFLLSSCRWPQREANSAFLTAYLKRRVANADDRCAQETGLVDQIAKLRLSEGPSLKLSPEEADAVGALIVSGIILVVVLYLGYETVCQLRAFLAVGAHSAAPARTSSDVDPRVSGTAPADAV